jgi:type I restriction enzyme S subunit
VTFQRGYDLPLRLRETGEIPIVSSAGSVDYHNASMVDPPGVVTGRYGTIGKVFLIAEPFWPLNTTLYVRDFQGNDPHFVYYLLQRFDFVSFSGKSGVPGVNRNDLHRETVALPPLVEQRAIAAALSDVDALLDGLTGLIAKKRDLKQAAMQQLLTGQTRLPGFHGEWEVKAVRDIVSTPITDGPHLTPKFLADGIPFLSVNNLVSHQISFHPLRFISKANHSEFSKKCKPQRGDILFGKAASVGMVALIETDMELNIWSSLALIRVGRPTSARFVCYALQARHVHRQIKLLTNSSSQGNIGMGEIGLIEIPLPELDEQTAIAAVLSDMDAEIAALEARRDKTRALKLGMMQELLTGRIRLV